MIRVATAEQIYDVALNMRERDFQEFIGTSVYDTREELAQDLARRYGGRDDVLCVSIDDEPICIGGTVETWPGVMTLLLFATDEFHRVGLEVTRFVSKRLFPGYEASGIHRIQAISLAGYDEIHDWLRTLGLREEATLTRFGKEGQDYVQFARVTDVRPAN